MEAGRQLPLEKDVEHDFQCSSSRADLSKLNIDAIGAGENGGFIKEAAKDQKQNSQQEPNRSLEIKANMAARQDQGPEARFANFKRKFVVLRA